MFINIRCAIDVHTGVRIEEPSTAQIAGAKCMASIMYCTISLFATILHLNDADREEGRERAQLKQMNQARTHTLWMIYESVVILMNALPYHYAHSLCTLIYLLSISLIVAAIVSTVDNFFI